MCGGQDFVSTMPPRWRRSPTTRTGSLSGISSSPAGPVSVTTAHTVTPTSTYRSVPSTRSEILRMICLRRNAELVSTAAEPRAKSRAMTPRRRTLTDAPRYADRRRYPRRSLHPPDSRHLLVVPNQLAIVLELLPRVVDLEVEPLVLERALARLDAVRDRDAADVIARDKRLSQRREFVASGEQPRLVLEEMRIDLGQLLRVDVRRRIREAQLTRFQRRIRLVVSRAVGSADGQVSHSPTVAWRAVASDGFGLWRWRPAGTQHRFGFSVVVPDFWAPVPEVVIVIHAARNAER